MFGRKKKDTELSKFHAPDGIEPMNLADWHGETTALAAIAKLFDVYQPGVVFSQPTTVGDTTVITAAEVHVALGLGFGHGSGGQSDSEGDGGGGGGGGASAGRPVAAIVIGSKDVQVEPIVDVTKIALAFFTTIGAMFMAWRAMRRIK